MSNAANNGTLIGRLAADPKIFGNSDGSKKVLFTLYVDRAYRTADGKTISDQISTEAFVSSKVDGIGPFSYAHQGDLVALGTHIEQLPYTAKNGEIAYPAAKVVVDSITFLESRGATQARLAKRAVAAQGTTTQPAETQTQAVEEGANAYDNESPFAGAAN
ncbi:single-stranded DNA-binding protein [Arthrobacter sp. AD-310]